MRKLSMMILMMRPVNTNQAATFMMKSAFLLTSDVYCFGTKSPDSSTAVRDRTITGINRKKNTRDFFSSTSSE